MAFDCGFRADFEVNTECRLRKDYTIHMNDHKYTRLGKPVAIGATALCVVGVPALYGLLLYSRRRVLNPRGASGVAALRQRDRSAASAGAAYLAPLYQPFKPTYWYFELVNLFRQLWLCGIVSYKISDDWGPGSSVALSLAFMFGYVGILLRCKPYANDSDNFIQEGCAVVQM